MKQSGVLVAGNIISFAINFFIPIIVVRYLTKAEFGVYKQIFLIFNTFFNVFQFGLVGMHFRNAIEPPHNRPTVPRWWELMADEDLQAEYRAKYQDSLDVILFEGYRVHELMLLHQGTHLVVSKDGRLQPVKIVVLPLQQDEDAGDALLRTFQQHEDCQETLQRGETAGIEDPFQWRPVLTLRQEGEYGGVDFRIGGPVGYLSISELLPLPPELQD